MSGALDYVTRFVMLVLAGLVSLSIIGAIAAMSSSEGVAPPPGQQRVAQQPVPVEAQRGRPVGGQAVREAATAGGAGAAVQTVVAPPPEEEASEKWLEAIAYALMAITGLLALIAVILWRGLGLLRER